MSDRQELTEAEYILALQVAELIFGSKPGTVLGDILDGLVNNIETYEAKHFPVLEDSND